MKRGEEGGREMREVVEREWRVKHETGAEDHPVVVVEFDTG